MAKVLESTETTGTEFQTPRTGPYSVQVKGASATITVTVQRKDADGNWLAVGGGSWASPESRLMDAVAGGEYRIVASAVGPEAWIDGTAGESVEL